MNIFGKKLKKVALINIDGVIMGGSGKKGLLGGKDGVDNLLAELYDIAYDEKIAGVILRINSPGGSAAASQEVYELIEFVKSQGKVVIASMADVTASGGYMIASACNYIVASPSTITGSIGVIFEIPYYKELADKIGYNSRILKAGKLKDIGNPMREMTLEEEIILQNLVLECHEEFIRLVSDGRKLNIDRVRELADGRIYTGRQAFEQGLVDKLGNFYTAVNLMKKELNVTEIDLKERKSKKGILNSLLNVDSVIDNLKCNSLFPKLFLR